MHTHTNANANLTLHYNTLPYLTLPYLTLPSLLMVSYKVHQDKCDPGQNKNGIKIPRYIEIAASYLSFSPSLQQPNI